MILVALGIGVIAIAGNEASVRTRFYRILTDLQGGVAGGPVQTSGHVGILGEFDNDEGRFRGRGYDTAYDRFSLQLSMSKLMAISPERAARSIRRTLQVRSPRARYLLGPDANLVARGMSLVPTRVRDTASRLGYGL